MMLVHTHTFTGTDRIEEWAWLAVLFRYSDANCALCLIVMTTSDSAAFRLSFSDRRDSTSTWYTHTHTQTFLHTHLAHRYTLLTQAEPLTSLSNVTDDLVYLRNVQTAVSGAFHSFQSFVFSVSTLWNVLLHQIHNKQIFQKPPKVKFFGFVCFWSHKISRWSVGLICFKLFSCVWSSD